MSTKIDKFYMNILHDFYIQPMNQVYIETIAIYVVWTVAMLLLCGKTRRILAFVGTVLSFRLIFQVTIHDRSGTVLRIMTPFMMEDGLLIKVLETILV